MLYFIFFTESKIFNWGSQAFFQSSIETLCPDFALYVSSEISFENILEISSAVITYDETSGSNSYNTPIRKKPIRRIEREEPLPLLNNPNYINDNDVRGIQFIP